MIIFAARPQQMELKGGNIMRSRNWGRQINGEPYPQINEFPAYTVEVSEDVARHVKGLEDRIAELQHQLTKEQARSKDYESAMNHWKELTLIETDMNAELTEEVERLNKNTQRSR